MLNAIIIYSFINYKYTLCVFYGVFYSLQIIMHFSLLLVSQLDHYYWMFVKQEEYFSNQVSII